MEDAESDLVARAQRGESEAFHRLVDRHGDHLFAVAYAMTSRRADAEDVVQETFLAAVRSIGRFERRSSLRTWLVGIAARQAALVRRKRRPAAGMTEEPAGGTDAGRADAAMDVAAVLATLSDEHRDVLVLRELEGMSYEEIGAALGLPRGTVESRIFRARQEMRGKLSGYEKEGRV